MGLFDKILGGGSSAGSDKIEWVPLTDVQQLNSLIEESKTQTVAIFKHSTRCGISRMVLRGFESDYELDLDQVKLYFLDLLNYRNISEEIASRFGVWHESPQLLVIKGGDVVYHTSHGSIQANKLSEFI